MNKILKRASVAAAMLMSVAGTYGIPARQGVVGITQSDGTVVPVTLYGDEHRSMYVSLDGYLLLPDGSGDLCFAVRTADGQVTPSAVKAADERTVEQEQFLASVDRAAILNDYATQSAAMARTAREQMRKVGGASARNKINNYPTKGEQKVLVILARFADVDFYHEDPAGAIGRMLNEEGYSVNGATGSVRDYFIDNSSGQYKPEMVVYGPVTLPQNMAYYGAPNEYGANDSHPAEMIRDACRLLDDEIDFREYDLDDDGYIDNVYLFYPGYSQADGASPNTIWPHAGYAYAQLRAEFDGVKLEHYACSNEIDLGTNDLVSIGTFCHEFTHVLGLPDFYSTDYSVEVHPGTWSLMANGGRNNGGKTPPCMSAYERYALGWLEPETLTPSDTRIELGDVTANKAYIYRTQDYDEFFIIENRQQTGWDTYLPGHGLLVWHVDYDASLWLGNRVNNDATHQHVDLMEADGVSSGNSRAGNAFPGTADVRSITDDTTPGFRSWDATASGLALLNIEETADGKVLFNVIDATAKLPTPVATGATEVSPVSFRANWNKVPGATAYVVEVYRKTRIGSVVVKTYVDGYRVRVVGDTGSEEVTGLEPATEYCYVVRAMGGSLAGDYSDEFQVRTSDKDFRFFAPETAEADNVTGRSFTARWKAMEGAESYRVSVYEVQRASEYVYTNDFSGNVVAPDGWGASPACATTAFYGGQTRPGLSMGGNLFIQSPGDAREVTGVSFWCRGLKSNWDDINEVRVSGYYQDGEWVDLKTFSPISTETAGETVTLTADEITMPVHSIRIEFNRPYNSGTLILDDIEITHSETSVTVVPGYSAMNAGNSLSLEVTGLKPETLYRYDVTANNGTLDSRSSHPQTVRTLESSGIDDVNADGGIAVRVDGGVIYISNRTSDTAGIEVYTMAGIKLTGSEAASGTTVGYQLPCRGVYVVKAGGKVYKVIG